MNTQTELQQPEPQQTERERAARRSTTPMPMPMPDRARRRIRSLIVVLAGAAAALVVWAIAVPALGVDLSARMGVQLQTVGPVLIAVETIIAGLVAWGVRALIERFTHRARRNWLILATALLVLSFAGPVLSGASAAATVTFVVMHLIVGGTYTLGLAPRRPAEARA